MQNVPGIALEKTNSQPKTVSPTVKTDQQGALFADLFNQHANLVESELALSPVSTTEKMLETAPQVDTPKQTVNAAGTEVPVKDDEETTVHDLDKRMSEEEFEEVRDDLEEYGLSAEEIADIEEKVKSEEGLTWGQFSAVVANKLADARTMELTDAQKDKLNGFFGKFGFTLKESEELTKQLADGNLDKVMNALREKIEAMPQNKQILFEKGEIEAFSAAMSFSKEFTSRIKELLGSNTLSKDVKEAFTMIRQELANLDKKDQELVRAVGQVFAKSMGDNSKESSAARQIKEAIDLKPRVAEENTKVETTKDFTQAVETHKDALSSTNTKKSAATALPEKAEVKTDADTADQYQDSDSEGNWNNFLGTVSEDGSGSGKGQMDSKSGNAETGLKSGLTEAQARDKAKAWEKISAPKVMKQVETALLKNLGNNTKQLTLQLTPENLGKLSIVLQVHGKEVNAVIRAENPEAAKIKIGRAHV